MNRSFVQPLISVILSVNLASGGTSFIGVATANGNFTIEKSSVTGNATLFEGSSIETGKVSPQLRLNDGARLQLATESRGKVFRGHWLLEKGGGEFTSPAHAPYEIDALSLRVTPAQSASARVMLRDTKVVEVAALTGPVRVRSSNGIVIANLAPGAALSFEQAGAAAPSTLTGCLRRVSSRFLLTDETANVTVELQGPDLDKQVNNRVEVTGTTVANVTPAAGASQVIQVTNLRQISTGCAVTPAGAAGRGAATAAGMSLAAKALIAGIIVAGAATGAAIAATRGGAARGALSPSTP